MRVLYSRCTPTYASTIIFSISSTRFVLIWTRPITGRVRLNLIQIFVSKILTTCTSVWYANLRSSIKSKCWNTSNRMMAKNWRARFVISSSTGPNTWPNTLKKSTVSWIFFHLFYERNNLLIIIFQYPWLVRNQVEFNALVDLIPVSVHNNQSAAMPVSFPEISAGAPTNHGNLYFIFMFFFVDI